MRRLIGFFVARPLVVNLMLVFIVASGLMATGFMSYELMPRIDLGLVNITTVRPGAGPEDVELSITLPLEEEILKVDGLKKVTSNSMEGISVIAVRLDPDADDKRQVMADIQKAVDRAGSRLRPILITSLTTVAGLLPTAYGLAGSNPFVTPMVLAMAWGILFGTVISLLLVPCLYAVDQDLKRGVLRRAFG